MYTQTFPSSGRRWSRLQNHPSGSTFFGLWCLTAVFASATADAETDGKCHRRQGRSPRQVADVQRLIREIRVFPPQAQTFTKHIKRHYVEASVGESVGFMEHRGINHTVSPLGREADQLCPPAEDLKDFLSSKKTFKSGEEKAGSIDNIGESRYLAYGRLL